jgi:hypothetical protein
MPVKIPVLAIAFCCALMTRSAAVAQTASLLLNEVSPNITSSHDLIELLVVKGGNTQGITIQQGISSATIFATLPSIDVQVGDRIIVHLNPATATGSAPASETFSIAQYPTALYSANYDTAWDVLGGADGVTYTSRVLLVKDANGAIQDAVPFAGSSAPASFFTDLQTLQSLGLWFPADCGGSPCTGISIPAAQDISVNWTGAGTSPAGNSVQRKSAKTFLQSTDWTVAASTLGVLNPGQAFLFIQRTNNAVVISWSSGTAGVGLEQSTNLVSWTASTAGNSPAPIPLSGTATFYRLHP